MSLRPLGRRRPHLPNPAYIVHPGILQPTPPPQQQVHEVYVDKLLPSVRYRTRAHPGHSFQLNGTVFALAFSLLLRKQIHIQKEAHVGSQRPSR